MEQHHLKDKYLTLLRDAISDALFEIPITAEGNKDYPNHIAYGKHWPSKAVSMVGLARLDNIRELLEKALKENIPGDFLEAGVWRGGACIFARGVLDAHGSDRQVIVADSFEGLPPPDEKYPVDRGSTFHTAKQLAISLEEVRNNFSRFHLLGDDVKFIKGFFKDSFSGPLPFEQLAVLRLDGDMYSSTIESLEALYDKVSPGGYIIIDDYALGGSNAAVNDFRKQRGITAPIHHVDWTGVWWQKPL